MVRAATTEGPHPAPILETLDSKIDRILAAVGDTITMPESWFNWLGVNSDYVRLPSYGPMTAYWEVRRYGYQLMVRLHIDGIVAHTWSGFIHVVPDKDYRP